MDSMIPEFKKTYLFHDFSDQELMSVARVARRRTVAEGEMLAEPHGAERSIFLIHYGSIRMQAVGPHRHAEVVQIQGMGTLLGDISFMSEKRALFSAEAVEKSEVFELTHDELNQFLAMHPEAAHKFYRALATRASNQVMMVLQAALELKESQLLKSGRVLAF